MPETINTSRYPIRSNVYGFIAVIFIGAAILVQLVGSGLVFGPRQEESGLMLLSWGGLGLGGVAVALGLWGVFQQGRLLSIVSIVISLPVLAFGVFHL